MAWPLPWSYDNLRLKYYFTGGWEMDFKITGTNLNIPAKAQRYIEAKYSKLNKHLPDIIDIKVEISEEGTKSPSQRYVVKAAVNSGVGRTVFHGEERAEDLLIAADRTLDVLTRQLEKHKGKLYQRGRRNPFARGKMPLEAPPQDTRRIVKTKSFIIEPMTREDAIEQMERLGHNFFLFTEEKSVELELLYRRKDGNYGIIRPQIVK
jgi:putative sigma-54 modulation protein